MDVALEDYGLDVRTVALVGRDTNLVYRVKTRDGGDYALRLAAPGWRTLTDLESEAAWLEAIARDTDIPAPRIVRSTEGEPVLVRSAEGLPQERTITLMTWLPGVPLGRRLSETNLEKLGRLFAELHVHGASWKPPAGFTERRFDRFLSRGEPDVIHAAQEEDGHAARSRDVVAQALGAVEATYRSLDPADLRVIHCDLWHDNVKVHRGVLQPFDFEDTVWGFRLHDIAMAMLDLYEEGDPSRYPELLAAFRQGYEARLDWPDGDLAALQLGRILWRVNWIARFQRQHLADNLVFHLPHVERYLETGDLLPFGSDP